MEKKLKQAFTVVEVLIGLSIVGLLTAAVLIAADEFREAAHDSNVRQSLAHVRNVAEEVYYGTYPNSYLPVCFDSPVDLILKDATTASGFEEDGYQCMSTSETWVTVFPLKNGNYWCSDSSGNSVEVGGFIPYTGDEYMKCIYALALDPDPALPPAPGESLTEEEEEAQLPPPPPPVPSNTPPVLTLLGDTMIEIWSPSNNPFRGGAWHKFHEPGYAATDVQDGNLLGEVIVLGPTLIDSGGPKNCKENTYRLVYSVTDSGGLSDGPDVRTVLHHKCLGP